MPHWRDFTNSTLLGAYSCYSDKEDRFVEINGTILRCEIQEHTLGGSGKTKCLVGVTDIGKPIKINIVAISSVLQQITGSRNPDKWVNVPVTFYVDENVKFGKHIVEAIRIKRQQGASFVAVLKTTLNEANEAFDNVDSRDSFEAAMKNFNDFLQNETILTKCKELSVKYPKPIKAE